MQSGWAVAQADSAGILFLNSRKVRLEEQCGAAQLGERNITSIGSTPNPILSAHYSTKLVGQHLLHWVKEFLAHNVYKACHSHMRHTDIVIYKSYSVETANDTLIKQVVLFLDPNWFGQMTLFMCTEKMRAFEQAYEMEAGELGPEGMYSAVLMPVLKATSNGSIVSNWEACPNGGMADKWESDDGEEEKVDSPLHVVDPSSFAIRDQSACNCMIICHARSLDLNEGILLGISKEEDSGRLSLQGRPEAPGKMLCESSKWVKYDWLEEPEHSGLGHISVPENQEACIFQLAEWKLAWWNVARSEESILLSKEVADDDEGMFPEHFKENLSDVCEEIPGVPSDWTEYTKNAWTPAHIWWMMKSIWFCGDRHGCFHSAKAADNHLQADPPFCLVVLPTQYLRERSGFWLATGDPMSSDMDTGPSNGEGNIDKDVGYRVVQPPTTLMNIDPPAPEGEPSRNKTVVYKASSDNGSREDKTEDKVEVKKEVKPKKKSGADRKKEEKDHDTDNEREEEEEVHELDGRGIQHCAHSQKER
ncbi:hypothetical protein ARMGADRAFT_1033788 [Armillaria gallica]|uniref:Uncharacterized protein n=1 Tax=Armillaria gallica TaxID=47427 RepID=A0A2H3DD60_ARMGA|nr:hypothetical protein ARMGADRAFT_1033788 [Armillaria gallica]